MGLFPMRDFFVFVGCSALLSAVAFHIDSNRPKPREKIENVVAKLELK
jgi:hypothetical protein